MPAALGADEMTELVEEYGDEMLRLAIVYLGSREMAEDAVQESFLKIFRHYRPGPNPRAFVMKVLVNTCKDLLKSSWRRRVDLVADYGRGTVLSGKSFGGADRPASELPPAHREHTAPAGQTKTGTKIGGSGL